MNQKRASIQMAVYEGGQKMKISQPQNKKSTLRQKIVKVAMRAWPRIWSR